MSVLIPPLVTTSGYSMDRDEVAELLYAEHNYVEPPGATNAYCKYNSQVLELVISCLYLAALVAAIGSEVIARRYGRRVCT